MTEQLSLYEMGDSMNRIARIFGTAASLTALSLTPIFLASCGNNGNKHAQQTSAAHPNNNTPGLVATDGSSADAGGTSAASPDASNIMQQFSNLIVNHNPDVSTAGGITSRVFDADNCVIGYTIHVQGNDYDIKWYMNHVNPNSITFKTDTFGDEYVEELSISGGDVVQESNVPEEIAARSGVFPEAGTYKSTDIPLGRLGGVDHARILNAVHVLYTKACHGEKSAF